jgi:hypothetical protein
VVLFFFQFPFASWSDPCYCARPVLQTVATFILREFDQGSPATGMAMGVIALFISMLSIGCARRLVPKQP